MDGNPRGRFFFLSKFLQAQFLPLLIKSDNCVTTVQSLPYKGRVLWSSDAGSSEGSESFSRSFGFPMSQLGGTQPKAQ